MSKSVDHLVVASIFVLLVLDAHPTIFPRGDTIEKEMAKTEREKKKRKMNEKKEKQKKNTKKNVNESLLSKLHRPEQLELMTLFQCKCEWHEEHENYA